MGDARASVMHGEERARQRTGARLAGGLAIGGELAMKASVGRNRRRSGSQPQRTSGDRGQHLAKRVAPARMGALVGQQRA
jgi:hypothetical protein